LKNVEKFCIRNFWNKGQIQKYIPQKMSSSDSKITLKGTETENPNPTFQSGL